MALCCPVAIGLTKGHRHHCHRFTKCTNCVWDVCGFAPDEGQPVELFKISKDKSALSFIKKRVGKHIPAKRKNEELSNVLATMGEVVAKKD
ncbi:hypothetical protein FD755_010647 [Muntiacus reevesi]|uniref:Large ribosomal subunit protein eL36 n=1 Tax=Muntiacus reevesi TaxID=9886 RepID=A0A5N3XYQ7_MUNRE|nr:hypothetical protein FD755_010647 [Muntiacus reevesi]